MNKFVIVHSLTNMQIRDGMAHLVLASSALTDHVNIHEGEFRHQHEHEGEFRHRHAKASSAAACEYDTH